MKYANAMECVAIVSALLVTLSTSHGASITLDGINSPRGNYTSESTTWFNGHNPAISKPTSSSGNIPIYGDFANQLGWRS